MKTYALAVVGLFVLCGCKGSKGAKGDTGAMGVRGPSSTDILIGSVVSNSFTVSDSRIGSASVISVYLNAGNDVIELPYFLPAQGVNTGAIIRPLLNQIEIDNAVLAGATQYIISLTF